MNTQRQVTDSQRAELIRAIDENGEMAFLFLEMLSLGPTLTDGKGTLDQAESNVRTFTDELGKQYLTTWCQRCADAALQAELDKGDCRHHEKKSRNQHNLR